MIAIRSPPPHAQRKGSRRPPRALCQDGSTFDSLRTLLQDLAAVMRNTGITRSPKAASPDSHRVTPATETDHCALQLLAQITV